MKASELFKYILLIIIVIGILFLIFRKQEPIVLTNEVLKPDSNLIAKYDSLKRIDSLKTDSLKKLKYNYEKAKIKPNPIVYINDSDLQIQYRTIIDNIKKR